MLGERHVWYGLGHGELARRVHVRMTKENYPLLRVAPRLRTVGGNLIKQVPRRRVSLLRAVANLGGFNQQ